MPSTVAQLKAAIGRYNDAQGCVKITSRTRRPALQTIADRLELTNMGARIPTGGIRLLPAVVAERKIAAEQKREQKIVAALASRPKTMFQVRDENIALEKKRAERKAIRAEKKFKKLMSKKLKIKEIKKFTSDAELSIRKKPKPKPKRPRKPKRPEPKITLKPKKQLSGFDEDTGSINYNSSDMRRVNKAAALFAGEKSGNKFDKVKSNLQSFLSHILRKQGLDADGENPNEARTFVKYWLQNLPAVVEQMLSR